MWEKRGKRNKEGTCWLNKEVNEAVSRKKYAHKVICRNSIENNDDMYKRMMNKARK